MRHRVTRHKFHQSTALLGVLAGLVLAGAARAEDGVRSFNIPAEPLSKALRDFGRQADQQLIFTEGLVAGRRGPAVVGDLSTDVVLNRLLVGTGLTWRRTPTGGVMILKADASPPQSDAAAGNASTEAVRPIDELVVTGTHIRGGDHVAPVIELDQKAFERGGFLDVGQALRSLPVNFGGGLNPESSVGNVIQDGAGNNGFHASSANLYGLGSGATLVLLNGRRLPAVGQGVSVDLSLVPVVAIDRIEVLADGASAVYGADAVAGVVNIITRKTFDGAEARLKYGSAQDGLETRGASFVTGGNLGGLSGVFGVERLDQSALQTADRPASQGHSQPNSLFGDTTRTSYFGSVAYDLTSRLQLTADAVYLQRAEDNMRVSGTTSTTFTNFKVDEYAVHAGLRADVGAGWTVDVAGTLNGNGAKVYSADHSKTTGSVTPFAPMRRENHLGAVEANASGPLATLPAGDLKAAVGVAYREEELRSGTPADDAQRHVTSVYGELEAPVFGAPGRNLGAPSLVLTAAARYDDYSDFGGQAVPKLGALWRLGPQLSIGVTASKSFRAPSMYELTKDYFVAIIDAADNNAARASRIMYLTGTGRPVGPERADNLNATVTYSPDWAPRATIQATYYRVNYRDRLAAPDPTFGYAFDIRGAPATLVQRGPTPSEVNALLANARTVQVFAANPGLPITAIVDARSTNVATTQMEGVHVNATYRMSLGGGDLDLTWDGNYLANFTEQLLPGSPKVERAGTIFSPADFRSRAGAEWSRGAWSVSGYWNFVDRNVDNRIATAPVPIKAWNTFDASLGFAVPEGGPAGLAGVRIVLNATNLFDAAPPHTAPAAITNYQWDATNASIVGRFVSLELVKRW